MPQQPDHATIEINLRESAQLFNTLDPFPFRERDLSAEAERHIVEWARELPENRPLEILIHLPPEQAASESAPELAAAVNGWFDSRAREERQAMRALFRDGRIGLLFGFAALAFCLFLSWSIGQRYEGPFPRTLQESLIILGWVVIWRPAEIFLYDWLPIARRKRLYLRLAKAQVAIRARPPGPAAQH
ncbi:hypothetical protein [Bosea thiooxidans]